MPLQIPYGSRQAGIKKSILVDISNQYLIDKHTWWIDVYGYPTTKLTKKSKNIKLHHLIIGKPLKGYCIDHKNGNKLDNRRENLHVVTYSYNSANKIKRKDSKQIYKGIQLLPSGNYRARSTSGKHIGTFKSAEKAKEAYIIYTEQYIGGKLYAS